MDLLQGLRDFGASNRQARRNAMLKQGGGGLPPSAWVPSQYPAGVSSGIGLPPSARVPSQYPAGASTVPAIAPQSASRFSGAVDKSPGRLTVDSTPRALERMNATAGAGLQGVRNAPGQGLVRANPSAQNAWDNAAVLADAKAAGEAAQKARYEQKMGYLYKENLPATSDPSQDAYWQRADMAMWAKANPGLAQQKGWDPSRDYSAPAATADYSSAYSSSALQPAVNSWSKEGIAAAPLAAAMEGPGTSPGFPREGAEFSPAAWDPKTPRLGGTFQSATPASTPMSGFQIEGDLMAKSDPQSARARVASAAGPLDNDTPAWDATWNPDGEPAKPMFDSQAMRNIQWNSRMLRGF